MTVRIFLDRFRLAGVLGCTEVSRADQLGPTCACIDEDLARGGSLDVVVTNPAMNSWFDQYRGLKQVSFVVCDPVGMLGQELGVQVEGLPAAIAENPSLVASSRLVEKARMRPHNTDPFGWLYSEVCGGLWAGSLDTALDLTALVRTLCLDEALDSVSLEGLMRRSRAAVWAAESPFGSTVTWLLNGEPARRAQTLAANRFLLAYPQAVRVKALQFDGRWAELCQLENADSIAAQLDLAGLAGIALSPGQSRALRGYLGSALGQGSVDAILKVVSGHLAEEAESVGAYLKDRMPEIDSSWEPLLGRIGEVFGGSEAGNSLVSLTQRVRPLPEPNPLRELATWDEAKTWLTEEYFPYHEWAVTVGRLERTAGAVEQFEKWLLANYYHLTRTAAFAPYALREVLQQRINEGCAVLVVVDGLPWSFCRELSSLLEGRGIAGALPEPRITTLPSKTATAKPSLIRCQLPGQIAADDDGAISYDDLFSTSVGLRTDDVAVGTATDSSLQTLLKNRRRAYLYLCNDIDAIIHKPISAEKRREQVLKVLADLCEDIAEARQSFIARFGEEPLFILSSDHGFTELPKPASILSFTIADERQLSHCRVLECDWPVKVREDAATVTPEMLGGGKAAYVVPRGYACINSRPKGATHGGLTPQETIVPVWAIGSREGLLYQHIELAIAGDVRRGRASNPVQIALANPNRLGVWVDSIDVPRLAASKNLPVLLPPGGDLTLEGDVDGSGLRQPTLPLVGVVRVRFAGGKQATPVDQTIRTTGAAVSDESFEREFDE